jgi:hypothetical protein
LWQGPKIESTSMDLLNDDNVRQLTL